MPKDVQVDQRSRRKFIKTVAYVTPAIVTLSAVPSFASAGSGYQRGDKVSYRDRHHSNREFHHRSYRRSFRR